MRLTDVGAGMFTATGPALASAEAAKSAIQQLRLPTVGAVVTAAQGVEASFRLVHMHMRIAEPARIRLDQAQDILALDAVWEPFRAPFPELLMRRSALASVAAVRSARVPHFVVREAQVGVQID